jgi:hypothetical protein
MVLTHTQAGYTYHDLMAEVVTGLQDSVEMAMTAGVPAVKCPRIHSTDLDV